MAHLLISALQTAAHAAIACNDDGAFAAIVTTLGGVKMQAGRSVESEISALRSIVETWYKNEARHRAVAALIPNLERFVNYEQARTAAPEPVPARDDADAAGPLPTHGEAR